MARFNLPLLFPFQVFGLLSSCILYGFCSKEIQNLQTFSENLISQTDFDKISTSEGASAFAPFGIGYALANVNSKVWNVSSVGFERLLNVPLNEISDQYASLVEKLKQANISSSSALYPVNCTNCSINLPEESEKLHTSLNYIDYVNDWKNSWYLMNDMTSDQMAGALDGSVVPRGGWFGHPFYPFGVAAYINTNYFKSAWAQTWNEIGYKNFSDGFSVPFYQVEGTYPSLETENFTAVAIQLSDERKFGVFVYVKESPSQNFFQDQLPTLLKKGETWMNPSLWPMAPLKRKIQVPQLNFTLYSQYYLGFENYGINNTFCASGDDEQEDRDGLSERPFFAHPIVQTNYIHFSPDFLELASATGMTVNSEQRALDLENPRVRDDKLADNSGTEETGDASSPSKLQYQLSAENSPGAEQDTILFDQPFFWYLYDSEIGPVEHGLVRSFAQYKKAYDDLLNDPDFGWFYDLKLYTMWSCPYK